MWVWFKRHWPVEYEEYCCYYGWQDKEKHTQWPPMTINFPVVTSSFPPFYRHDVCDHVNQHQKGQEKPQETQTFWTRHPLTHNTTDLQLQLLKTICRQGKYLSVRKMTFFTKIFFRQIKTFKRNKTKESNVTSLLLGSCNDIMCDYIS